VVASPDDMLELRVSELLEALASERRAPGGGSAAAVAVALAAALVGKAARASRDRWPEASGAVAQADALRLRAGPLAQADAEAYAAALAALRPATASSRAPQRVGDALAEAAAVPLRVAEAGADVAELAALTAEKGDPDLRGEALAAALLAAAATETGARLVEINLATTEADERVGHARELGARARAAARRPLLLDA
jgi:formiminotetrahydrofolate cyclodeaminase